MYRYASQARMNVTNVKLRRRIVLGVVIFLTAAVVFLGIVAASAVSFRSNTGRQLYQRMANCAGNAIEQVNRMESTTNSATAQRLGVVRQYVYAMEQMNDMSVSLFGEEGRYAPAEAFTALYSDLQSYEALIQSAKTSTLDARSLLLSHLTSLLGYINGELTS